MSIQPLYARHKGNGRVYPYDPDFMQHNAAFELIYDTPPEVQRNMAIAQNRERAQAQRQQHYQAGQYAGYAAYPQGEPQQTMHDPRMSPQRPPAAYFQQPAPPPPDPSQGQPMAPPQFDPRGQQTYHSYDSGEPTIHGDRPQQITSSMTGQHGAESIPQQMVNPYHTAPQQMTHHQGYIPPAPPKPIVPPPPPLQPQRAPQPTTVQMHHPHTDPRQNIAEPVDPAALAYANAQAPAAVETPHAGGFPAYTMPQVAPDGAPVMAPAAPVPHTIPHNQMYQGHPAPDPVMAAPVAQPIAAVPAPAPAMPQPPVSSPYAETDYGSVPGAHDIPQRSTQLTSSLQYDANPAAAATEKISSTPIPSRVQVTHG